VSVIETPTRDHDSHSTGGALAAPPTKSADPEVRLLLTFTPSEINAGTLEVIATPVMVSQDPDCREEVRNLDSGTFDSHPLAELQIRALADRDIAIGETHFWSAGYRDCFSVDLRRAAQMHKTLKDLDRALQRLESEFGPPEKFTAYLARCSVALRIASFGFHIGDSTGWHHTNTYSWTDAPGMVHRIGARLERWRANGQ
jgi:hypothetical protein